jgi:hypothetical protein
MAMLVTTITLKAVGIIFLCDFITGFIHWLEDSYWTPETPIIGKWIIVPNWEHHKNGQAFLQKSWWKSCWDSVLISAALVVIAALIHQLNWEILLFASILANANQIHKWAHITRYENKPKIIGWLQKTYILQSTRQHGRHHRQPNNSCYCTVTNALNPLLDSIKFWRGLEYVIEKTISNFKNVFEYLLSIIR